MRTAVLALFVSLGITAALAIASFFGYDLRVSFERAGDTSGLGTVTQEELGNGPALIPVPSGTFRGPSAGPSVKGPTAPPPQE